MDDFVKNNIKKDLILKVAKERFARYGLKKTKMEEIAADLKMSKPTLYYYYQTKEQIYEEVLKYEIKEISNSLTEILNNESLSIEDKLSQYFKVVKNYFSEKSNLFQLQLDVLLMPNVMVPKSLYFKLIETEVEFLKALFSKILVKSKNKEDEVNFIARYLNSIARGILLIEKTDSEKGENIFEKQETPPENQWKFTIRILLKEFSITD